MEIEGGPFDIIVVGGGINGSGVARDAALRGLKVLLLDKTDIAAGTTSWSSRLIHGGLRYLEHGEIPLVYESLQERERLLHIASHLVFPLPLTLPIYGYHKRGPLTIRAGMIAYDILSWNKSLPRHRMYSRAGALAHEPGLNPRDLKAAARYYDAQIVFPERISVENMLDAVAHGAIVRNRARVDDLILEAGRIRGVQFEDESTGERHLARGGTVVNVAGPWVDRVLRDAGIETPDNPLLGVTKGTHIVVEPFPGAPSDALYIEAKTDGRPYFIIPWNNLYLIGTTDDRYDGDPNRVVPTEGEIAYLLEETNVAIPSAALTRDSVCYAYAGLRPLPHQESGSESAITRRHIIHDHAPQVYGLLSIVGGKLTTYRNLSEQTVDKVGDLLGMDLPDSTTGTGLLPGAPESFGAFARDFQQARPSWLGERSASYLLHIYGVRANDVVAMAERDAALREIVSPATGLIAAAIVFSFTDEQASTLTDAIMRRTMIGYASDAGFDALEGVGQAVAHGLGWDDRRIATELERHRDYMTRFLPKALVNTSFELPAVR
ncbi:MAG: glycerol-3-phosphate dehydrogenase/oxidase [Chloroflexota bacterium]|nr:glycerol-3-phosphate dehydrogenase/oxidase [Chloroflexota bacterium]